MGIVMQWGVTFSFTLTADEVAYLHPLVETQDYALMRAGVDDVCSGRGRGPDAGLVIDMWQAGDDLEEEYA